MTKRFATFAGLFLLLCLRSGQAQAATATISAAAETRLQISGVWYDHLGYAFSVNWNPAQTSAIAYASVFIHRNFCDVFDHVNHHDEIQIPYSDPNQPLTAPNNNYIAPAFNYALDAVKSGWQSGDDHIRYYYVYKVFVTPPSGGIIYAQNVYIGNFLTVGLP